MSSSERMSGSGDPEWDCLSDFNDFTLAANKSNGKKYCFAAAALGITALLAGGFIAAYVFSPGFHSLADHAFHYLQNGKMTAWQGLLFLSLPVATAAAVISLSICFIKNHKRRLEKQITLSEVEPSPWSKKEIGKSLKAAMPNRKQILLGTAGLLAIGLIVAAGWLIHQYWPAGNAFMQHVFNHKMTVWQGALIFGVGTAVAATATALAISLLRKYQEKREEGRLNPTLSLDSDDEGPHIRNGSQKSYL